MKENKPNVMIDLETMGIGNEAAIIAIGATKFDPYTDRAVFDSFYARVDLGSSVLAGLKIDAATVIWWLSKDQEEAREKLLAEEGIGIWDALDGFAKWYGQNSLPTWGNGAAFDLVVMRNAFQKTGIAECPWKFWDERCFRTIKNVHGLPAVAPPEGVNHHALYDAILQTYQTQAIHRQFAP